MPEILRIYPTRLKKEKVLLEFFPREAAGAGVSASVMSMGQFEKMLIGELVSAKPIGDVERWLLLHHVITTEKSLRADASLARLAGTDGFVNSVGELIQQIKLGLVNDVEIENISDFAPHKEEWVKKVFLRYNRMLVRNGMMDDADVRMTLIDALKTLKKLPRSLRRYDEIAFYDIYHFTPFRFELIYLLASMIRVTVTFPLPDDRVKVFKFVEGDIQKFQALGDRERNLELNFYENSRRDGAPLETFVGGLFNDEKPPPVEGLDTCLEILKNSGRYREMEEVAQRILELKEGAVWSDFCLVFRNLEKYGLMVEDVFRRAGIPLFIRRGVPIRSNPYMRIVMSVFRAIESGYARDEIVKLVSSDYFSLLEGREVGQRLESLLMSAGIIDGPLDIWKKKLAVRAVEIIRDPELGKGLKKIYSLLSALEALSKAGKAEACLESFQKILKILKPKNMRSPDSGSLRDVYCRSKLDEVMGLAARVSSTAGIENSPFTWVDLKHLLLNSLGNVHTPEWCGRNHVYALNVHELAGLKFRYLFICGLHDGEFPRHMEKGSILTEHEKMEFNRRHAESVLADEPYKRRGRKVFSRLGESWEEESFLFYLAACAASQKLFLSYSAKDLGGGELSRSQFLDDILGDFSQLKERQTEMVSLEKDYSMQLDATAKEAKLLRDIFHKSGTESGTLRDYYRRFAGDALKGREFLLSCEKSKVEVERNRFYSEYREEERAKASNAFTGKVGKSQILDTYFREVVRRRFSPTSLESYSSCPFRYFMDRVLECKPRQEPSADIEKTLQGSVIHEVLEKYLEPVDGVSRLPTSEAGVANLESIRKMAREVFSRWESEGVAGEEQLWEILKEQVTRVLELFVQAEEEAYEREPFSTIYTEYDFRNDPVPLTVGGETIWFAGAIDRVDYMHDSRLVRVIDYKYSSNQQNYQPKLDPSKFCLESFQVPIYLYAILSRLFKDGYEPKPKGGYGAYYLLKKKPKMVARYNAPSIFEEVESLDDVERLNTHDDFGIRVVAQVHRMEGGDFSVTPKDCLFCLYKSVCRYRKVMDPNGGK